MHHIFSLRKVTLALLIFSSLPSTLSAEALAETTETTLQHAGIMVLGTKLDSESSQLPLSLKILRAEDIENSSANTLPDLLATIAGINIRTLFESNDGNTAIDMDGFGASAANNTLILLDGQRLNDIDLSGVNLSGIPLEFIERIEILPGSGSVLYGNGASGGTINIITKSEFDASGKVALSTTHYEGPGQAELTLGSSSDKLSNLLSFHSNNTDSYRDNNALKQRNLLFSSKYYLGNQSLLFLSTSFSEQEQGLPGARRVNPSMNENQIKDDPRGTDTPNDYGRHNAYRIVTGYKVFLKESGEFSISLGARNKNQISFSDFGGGFSSYIDSDLETLSFSPYYKDSVQFGEIQNTYTVGIDLYQSQYDSDRSLDKRNRNQPIHVVDIEQDITAPFFQNTAHLSDKVIFSAGARQEKVETKAQDSYDANAPTVPCFFPPCIDAEGIPFDIREKENTYSLGLKYLFSKQWNTYLRQESSTRFATVDEFFELDPNTFLTSLDPLKPQTGLRNELGVNFNSDEINLGFAYFTSKYKNEIHYDIDELGFQSQNVNLDDTKRNGARIELSYQLLNNIKLSANSAYTKATFEEGAYKGKSVPLVPRHTHNLAFHWGITQNLTFTSNTQYVGRKYFDNDQLNSFKQIPSKKITDIKFALLKDQLKWALTIKNLFDKEGLFDYGAKSTFTPGVYNGYTLPGREAQLYFGYTF